MKKLIMYFIVFCILIFLGGFLYANYVFNQKINSDKPIKINIHKGMGTKAIAKLLESNGIAQPGWLFEIYLKYLSFIDSKYLKAGVYLFPGNLTRNDVVDAIFSGEYLYIARVTFPEGIDYKEFASILSNRALIDSAGFVMLAENDSLLKARSISGRSVEGYLLPDTYEFYIESSASDVLNKLLDYHEKIYNRIVSQSANLKKLSKHQALTLASIVEAETPDDTERIRVAGLYLNRIDKKMLLQADPTVAYALGGKNRLLYEDLKIDNLYNTYKYPGLPPGPINNPGAKSIRAALNPEVHSFLYMVSIGDGSNLHNFAVNYKDHLKFVKEYRNRQKK